MGDNWFKEFCYEKDTLINATEIIKKYMQKGFNKKHYSKNYKTTIKWIEDFERDFILGQ